MMRLLGLIKKEFIHFYRDPVSMVLILYHFTACIILCGYCIVFEVGHLPVVVYDMNRTKTSRDLIQRFLSTEYFDLDSYATSTANIQRRLDSGRARSAVIIPPQFSRQLNEGRKAQIQYICEATDANQAGQGIGFAKRIIGDYNKTLLLEKLNRDGSVISALPGIDCQVRTLYNQEMDEIYFIVLIHIVVAGLIGGLILSSTAFVREKERGTIDQLLVTPVKTWEFITAKITAPFTISMIATVFSFLIVCWFDVPCKGSIITFFVFMGLFLLSTVGTGILIGSVSSNMLQAIMLSFAVWFPGIAMTGMLTPFENMSPFCQKMGLCMPATHFTLAANSIFQKSLGFAVLWPQAVILIGTGILMLLLGGYVTSRRLRQ
ncbi:MAG: ABC transporter permease [Thermodesulfobacteriota bacterium]|nr:ABC transporter permease [Thermodesulfobacteriota bacterium]